MAKERFQKRRAEQVTAPESSRRLGNISRRIDRGDTAAALAAINSELASETSERRKAKLLGQVARSLAKRGRFSEAADAFERSARLATSDPRDWLGPEVSRIRALIRDVSLADAEAAANACYKTAEEKAREFDRRRAGAREEFARSGRVVVPIKPHRPCVVASKLGDIFLLEGEPSTAKSFYELAIRDNPRGGTRARQGLAEIALRNDDPETAFQRAVEALTLGKFQGKTIATWKSLFAAKRKLNQSGLPAELVASIRACRPSVRARTTLVVVRELRANNDPQWTAIAEEWLAHAGSQFPAVAAELRKLVMSDAKRAMSNPANQIAAARQLLAQPGLAPHEWLAGAKEVVRASLFAQRNPGTQGLINEGVSRYGTDFGAQLQHSLALSCMMAKRHDLARPLLAAAIQAAAPTLSHIWSKALWALARMEAFLGNHADAAKSYLAVADAEHVPTRFRLQARLRWAENLLASGDTASAEAAVKHLPSVLQSLTDYETLLDIGRQLSLEKSEVRKLSKAFYDKGAALAYQAFSVADHPSVANEILFKITRRQVFDFGKSQAAAQFWEDLPQEKRLWLWSNNNRWWGYLSLVLIAYLRSAQRKKAEQLAGSLLDDPATPREALPAILVPYYEELIFRKSVAESLDAFRWIVTENPTRAQCATAYYWLALDALYSGNNAEALRHCQSLLVANQHTEITYDQWMLEAKARLLLSKIERTAFTSQATQFDETWIEKARDELHRHLALLAP